MPVLGRNIRAVQYGTPGAGDATVMLGEPSCATGARSTVHSRTPRAAAPWLTLPGPADELRRESHTCRAVAIDLDDARTLQERGNPPGGCAPNTALQVPIKRAVVSSGVEHRSDGHPRSTLKKADGALENTPRDRGRRLLLAKQEDDTTTVDGSDDEWRTLTRGTQFLALPDRRSDRSFYRASHELNLL